MVERRAAGEPLEYILGWAEFCGLHIAVDPGVFVPRRRSGLLVREGVLRCRPGSVVVDLCCGSGAVGMAVAAACPEAVLYAADIDPAVVRCARCNLGADGLEVQRRVADGAPDWLAAGGGCSSRRVARRPR
ncbi:methyltransferase [Cryobacterium fucosi]|uniref:methyltransferase n=1 Tax=Cryobacterium fucosi TaxID=1259157 RepID=UPI0030B9DD8C